MQVPVRRQIRAIEGPLKGAVYIIEGRATIGRASDAQIQIVHDGVSRHHAQLIPEREGRLLLTDLSSNNGTFVDGQRIVRHQLTDGDEFRILRFRFQYEELLEDEDSSASTSGVYAIKVTTVETLRQTVDHWNSDLPAPAGRGTATDFSLRRRSAEPGNKEKLAEGPGANRHAVVAVDEHGESYKGDVVSDIVEYRWLRVRSLRRDGAGLEEPERFDELERRLRQPSEEQGEPLRLFRRYECSIPVRLRYGGQDATSTKMAWILDIGAGGARVSCQNHPLAEGDLAWVVIDLVVSGKPRTQVFTCRVVRVDGEQLGLMFAGAPEWERWEPRRKKKRRS